MTQVPSPEDIRWMEVALSLAREAAAKDEVPVGAIIVKEGNIIGRGYNQVETLKDALAHAEMLALAEAEKKVGDWRLTGCTLYVTKEPCPMCAGAIIHCRLDRVVFGVSDPKTGACGGATDFFKLPGLNHRCECVAGVAKEESLKLLQEFFAKKRKAG